MHWLAIFVGGGLGAMGRFALSRALLTHAGDGFPWGTLCVNWLGCLAIGVATVWLVDTEAPPGLRVFVVTGLLGGFTTFSAFGLETTEMLARGAPAPALLYVLASVAGGLIGVGAGLALARALSA